MLAMALMEIDEILARIEWFTGEFEHEAVEAAAARRDEIVPELLRIVEDTVQRAGELETEEGYMAHLYAMFLLAQFREVRAYPLVLRFALLPERLHDSLCGDFIVDGFDRVLASVCGGDLSGIQSLIENENASEWPRVAALSSLRILVATGQKSRDDIMGYLARLFGKLVRKPSHVWGELVCCTADLCPAEVIEDIERASADDLIDPFLVGLNEVRDDAAAGVEHALLSLAETRHAHLVEDIVEEMSWWHCFHDDDEDNDDGDCPQAEPAPAVSGTSERKPAPAPLVPFVRAAPKIGRNEPCVCGSGKKHKKCCGV